MSGRLPTGETTGIAAPAAFQRAVADVQRGTAAHRDDLTAAIAAPLQLAVQRVTAKVDGYCRTCCDTQRAVAEVDVSCDGDIRTIVCYCGTQLSVRIDNLDLRPGCRGEQQRKEE